MDEGVEETYLIYEPFLYGELYKMLRLSHFQDQARMTVCRQYLEGLAWIHENGIMHRDVKPQNMGMKSLNPPEAVIFDFGHATFEETSMDHYKGTIWYLAPEVLNLKYRRSVTAYDRAVDVWAMGLSLYQMVCWKNDWAGQETVTDVQGRVRDYRLTRLDAVMQTLRRLDSTTTADVIRKMLQVDPRQRIAAKDARMLMPAEEVQEEVFTTSKRAKLG